MPEWNPMQLKAIQTKERNILVSASAGSGKTTVLIARLMDLVMKDHVSIDSILAMTFTEAAANEMKKRLATELQKALISAHTEEEKSYRLRIFPPFIPSAYPLFRNIITSSVWIRSVSKVLWITVPWSCFSSSL